MIHNNKYTNTIPFWIMYPTTMLGALSKENRLILPFFSLNTGAQTAMFRLEHVKNRLCNLERKQQHYLQLQQQQQQQQQQRQKLQQQQQQEQLQHQQQKPKQQQEQQQSQQQQQQPKQEHTN